MVVDPEIAIARCIARDNLDRSAVEQRISAQLSNNERIRYAHRVFNNDSDEEALIEQLEEAFYAISNGSSV